ncbi:MAG: HD domain-containing protein [Chloroflexi bacterium]|nr:HD domain-containing protein [Chloroflexota bacterium]
MRSETQSRMEEKELLTALHRFLLGRSLRAYVVGGYLRDHLLGHASHDVDVAVEGEAVSLARDFADEIGGSFVLLDQEADIARVVASRQGARWFVDLSGFQGDILQDLARRDFTIDAMAVPLEAALAGKLASRLIDPYSGMEDLGQRLVRALGPHVFQDDPLRLLRAVRLAQQLDFQIENSTERLIKGAVANLDRVAPERVRDELLKTLAIPRAARGVETLDSLGLLTRVLPELEAGRGVSQPKEHYWDVLQHNIHAVGQVERVLEAKAHPDDPVAALVPWHYSLGDHFMEELGDAHSRATFLKLSGLLHDVAKPQTKSLQADGRVRFLGHSDQGAEAARAALRRLRLSGRVVEAVATMIEHHLRPSQMAQPDQLPTNRAIYRYFRELDEVAIDTLYLSLADYLAARGPNLDMDDWRRYCATIGHILEVGLSEAAPERLPKLIDGHDLISLFGLLPGPHFRELLEAVRGAQAAGEVRTREEALGLVRELISSSMASAVRAEKADR